MSDGAKTAVYVSLTIPVLILAVWMSNNGPDGGGEADRSGAESTAMMYAKTFVKRHLKAPATADFPWLPSEYSFTDLGNNRWNVRSYVDAQNGFGATIRSQWSVTLQIKGDRVDLEDISIQ